MDITTMIPGSQQKPYKNKTCQQCSGTGKIFLRPNAIAPFIDCDMCEGTGGHELNSLWAVQGGIIREWRLKNDITLRECARKYSLDASNLSKMERGIIKPDLNLIILSCGGKKM